MNNNIQHLFIMILMVLAFSFPAMAMTQKDMEPYFLKSINIIENEMTTDKRWHRGVVNLGNDAFQKIQEWRPNTRFAVFKNQGYCVEGLDAKIMCLVEVTPVNYEDGAPEGEGALSFHLKFDKQKWLVGFQIVRMSGGSLKLNKRDGKKTVVEVEKDRVLLAYGDSSDVTAQIPGAEMVQGTQGGAQGVLVSGGSEDLSEMPVAPGIPIGPGMMNPIPDLQQSNKD